MTRRQELFRLKQRATRDEFEGLEGGDFVARRDSGGHLLALEWSPPRPEDLLLLRRQVVRLPYLAMLAPETLLVKILPFKPPLRRRAPTSQSRAARPNTA
jgi:hypothetical protein